MNSDKKCVVSWFSLESGVPVFFFNVFLNFFYYFFWKGGGGGGRQSLG